MKEDTCSNVVEFSSQIILPLKIETESMIGTEVTDFSIDDSGSPFYRSSQIDSIEL